MFVVLSLPGVGVLDVMAVAMWLCYCASAVCMVLWLRSYSTTLLKICKTLDNLESQISFIPLITKYLLIQ
jgi:hypothetical protein